MPHNQCPPSRRGHAWRELTAIESKGSAINGAVPSTKTTPDLRLCRRCGAFGRVSKQGIVHVLAENTTV